MSPARAAELPPTRRPLQKRFSPVSLRSYSGAVVAGVSPARTSELQRPTRTPLQKKHSLASLSCYSQIGVAVGDDFAVLANLDGFAIEHADAEAVTAEFDGSVGRRNPAFECRLGRIVVDRYLHVGSF